MVSGVGVPRKASMEAWTSMSPTRANFNQQKEDLNKLFSIKDKNQATIKLEGPKTYLSIFNLRLLVLGVIVWDFSF